MIITASRRTDIPAFYSAWFLNRLKAGYALVPNPRNPQRLGRVELSPRIVDCIVFWSKNPAPMFERFREIETLGYPSGAEIVTDRTKGSHKATQLYLL